MGLNEEVKGSRLATVRSSGTRRSDVGVKAGGGQKHGDDEDGVSQRGFERAIHGRVPGHAASKVARTACQKRGLDRGEELAGDEDLLP